MFCLILSGTQTRLLSQSSEFLDGKVINIATGKPVPFATIKLKINQLGVYANAEGDFKISKNDAFQVDSLNITCIGFKQSSLAYKDLQDSSINKVFLSPVVYGLNEVKVTASRRKMSSMAIIRKAVRSIGRNYPGTPFNYISYYRDYQKVDSTYINLNEAIVQTLDNGFEVKSNNNNYKLLEFRKNTEFSRMDLPYYYAMTFKEKPDAKKKTIPNAILGDQYGNELFILMVHDAIRNFDTRSFSYVETFAKDFVFNHLFSDPVIVFNNDLALYKITFRGRPIITGDSLKIEGAIYIQPRDFSIHKLEYSSYSYTKSHQLKPMYNIDIEYGYENSTDSRMCLKYISFNNLFKTIAINDTKVFKVLSSGWDTLHAKTTTLTVNFNNNIDLRSASNKKHYDITVGNKTVKIKSIQVVGKKLFIRLEDEDFTGKSNTCRVAIKSIRDTDGRVLDEKGLMEVYQFRELFVQEYNRNIVYTDTCMIGYNPLEQNCISKYSGDHNYWMNTPANIKSFK